MSSKKELDVTQKKMDILNSKISIILPELISRNTKLGERLKNKLKVSTLFNNIEHRNNKYLKGFIFSSNKRAKDTKTGLDIDKAIKQNNKKLELLCNQMKEDLILKNSDILLKEKKLLNENTEQETHLKINDCIHTLKNIIKSPISSKNTSSKRLIKSMSENELEKAKKVVGNKIMREEKDIQEKINEYINVMRNSFDNRNLEINKIKIKKNFSRFTENMYINDKMKMINYTKPNPPQIKDKENANLVRIKKFLYPIHFMNKRSRNIRQNNNIDFKKNISMNNIYNHSNNNKSIKQNNTFENKLKHVEVCGKDTMEVLNHLVDQREFLSDRFAQKFEKINSLIDISLPYPSNYDKILKYMNKYYRKNDNDNDNYMYFNNHNNNNNINNSQNTFRKIMITPDMRKKILSLKEVIKYKKFDFPENFCEPNSENVINNNENNNIKIKKIKNVNNDLSNHKCLDEKVFVTSKIEKSESEN